MLKSQKSFRLLLASFAIAAVAVLAISANWTAVRTTAFGLNSFVEPGLEPAAVAAIVRHGNR